MDTERLIDHDSTFIRGMVSSTDVATVPMGAYHWSMNMVHRGGVLMVRPGYRCLVTLPQGRLQGAALFKPKSGLEQMVVAIDGVLWVSDYPFIQNFRQIPNILFSADAPKVYFQMCEQSVQRTDTIFEATIEFLDAPKNILTMQDGGRTAPAYYDGFSSGHSRDNEWGIPIGGPMAWVGDRLWVANGTYVYASDIADPTSFREQIYLGGITSFVMPGLVTAMAVTPSLEFQQLLVFTEQTTTLIQANVRTRSNWPNIDGFQTELYKIGCVSQRSVTTHYGQLWWMSPQGVVNIDMATQSKITSRIAVKDIEMTISGIGLSGDLSTVAAASFGNYVLMSVPFEDVYNTHTWVLDNAAAESLQAEIGATWSGYWTGTRPVEWVYGVIASQERIFYVSRDYDDQNRLWMAFTDDREDNSCPITWAFATRGYFGPTAGINYPPARDKWFCYADLALTEIRGPVDVGVFLAGAARGQYKKAMEKLLIADRGSLRYDKVLAANSIIFALKPQSRLARTEDMRQLPENVLSTCPVERDILEHVDESFQLVVVGMGHAGVRWIRAFAQPKNENLSGECLPDETEHNAVRFDGAAFKDASWDVVESALAVPADFYPSTQVVTVSQSGHVAVATASTTSVINQGAADRVATAIAIRIAEKELRDNIPPTISDGDVDR